MGWLSNIGSAISGFFSGFQGLIIKIALILLVAAAIYLYWLHLENTITTLGDQNAALASANNANLNTIANLQSDYKKSQDALNKLNIQYTNIQNQENQNNNNFNASTVTEQTKKQFATSANTQLNTIFNNLNLQTQPSNFQTKAGKLK